jgi:hypothetical protein
MLCREEEAEKILFVGELEELSALEKGERHSQCQCLSVGKQLGVGSEWGSASLCKALCLSYAGHVAQRVSVMRPRLGLAYVNVGVLEVSQDQERLY